MANALEKIMVDVANFGSDVSVTEQASTFGPRLRIIQADCHYSSPVEYRFGPHERHLLDAYKPTSSAGKRLDAPVLLFHYGGYFARGDKTTTQQVYANLGSYFAARGFWVLVCDYRLVSHGARYPDSASDLSLVIQWLEQGHVEGADISNVFLLGNSAGGMNVCTYLYNDQLQKIGRKASVRGACLLSVGFEMSSDHFQSVPSLIEYYGDYETYAQESPQNLLEHSQNRLPLLVLWATYDPIGEVQASMEGFQRTAIQRSIDVECFECVGHNHITPPLVLGLGKYEEWAEYAAKWMWNLVVQ